MWQKILELLLKCLRKKEEKSLVKSKPDSAGLYHDKVHKDIGKPRPVKVKRKEESMGKYKFGKTSKERLVTVDQKLQDLMQAVLDLEVFDLSVLEGKRSLERQKELVSQGKSKTLKSKHLEGKAVDVAIWESGGYEWDDSKAYYVLAGLVLAEAKRMNIKIRWGGNWDRDADFNDQDFNDLVHFELDE